MTELVAKLQWSTDPRALLLWLKRWGPFVGLGLVALLAGWVNLRGYLLPEFNTLLALIGLPFVLYVRDPERRPGRFAGLALLMLVLFPVLQIKFAFHLAWCFVLLFFVESVRGKLNSMPVALVFVLSPLPHYLASVLGFPLRLWLSSAAGAVFRLLGMEVEVRGNLFLRDGEEFAVDPACTGIHLFVTGLVLFVILLSYQEKRSGKGLPGWGQGGTLVVAVGLVLLANLMRIVGLVLLRSAPETFSHDAVGLASLLFYFVLPMYFLLGWATRKWGRNRSVAPTRRLHLPGTRRTILGAVLVAGLFAVGPWGQKPVSTEQIARLNAMATPGYTSCLTDAGILALEAEGALVYLKPPVPFYGADHYPEICWRASGFRVRAPQVQVVAGTEMMVARLENEEQRMVTAWWYDNGAASTTSTFDWRWRQLCGEAGFFLVNVTVADQDELACVIREWQGARVIARSVRF
ncbi:MAG: exosortase N [Bacteroidota bacterium]